MHSSPSATSRAADHLAVDANALAIRDQVRGGEEARAVTLRAADRVDHRADGAFAVRASDVDDSLFFIRNVERSKQAPDALQPELNSEQLRAEQPRERLAVALTRFRFRGRHPAHCSVER
jgi:hypothetical protein